MQSAKQLVKQIGCRCCDGVRTNVDRRKRVARNPPDHRGAHHNAYQKSKKSQHHFRMWARQIARITKGRSVTCRSLARTST